MKLGYTEFIEKHLGKFLIAFVICILLLFISPITYLRILFEHNSAMQLSFYFTGVQIILFPLTIKELYVYELNNNYITTLPFNEYFKTYTSEYALLSIGSLIFWFTIISFVIILVQHFKGRNICKPLLCLPLALYIIFAIIECAFYKCIPFVGFYLAIILEVLVMLYCFKFQRFPSRKPHDRKLSDKERIAELERQVAELQKEKDAE